MPGGIVFSTLVGAGMGGVSTAMGSIAGCMLGRFGEKILPVLLSAAAGIILALVGFELFPESAATGGYTATTLGLLAGVFASYRLDGMSRRVAIISFKKGADVYLRSGLLLALGIAVHNFPVGLAMGSGLMNDVKTGTDLAVAMLFHNFPEGLAMSIPMVLGGMDRIFIVSTASAVAVPAGFGAFLGSAFGYIPHVFLAVIFGTAIGTILYVTCHEIIGPLLKSRKYLIVSFGLILGALAGRMLAFLVSRY
ncbi:MAG: ZIP family metal transporter [Actinobacteria bacterium]|nr:ZIP family metal transporter [Actinomycetota bacterium]